MVRVALACCIAAVLLGTAVAEEKKTESGDALVTAPTFVLLGATGNLAAKYLWQILFELYLNNKVSYIVGGATKKNDIGQGLINDVIEKKVSCEKAAKSDQIPKGMTADFCEKKLAEFKNSVVYQQLRNNEQYGDLSKLINNFYADNNAVESGRFFYLSVSPDFYPQIAENINTLARPSDGAWLRAIYEKPFGRDSASAQQLSDSLTKHMVEDEIYRIDHYLGKRSVRDIGAFRLLNRAAYDGLLNKDFVDYVEVVQKETEDVAGRTWFYDNYGAVRDLLQNHLSEVLALTIADLPDPSSKESTVDRFSAISQLVAPSTQGGGTMKFAQYEEYISHVREDKKDATATSAMPTAAFVELRSTSNRWEGVKFFVAHGKALDERVAFSRIVFKPGVCSGRSDGESSTKCEMLFHLQGGKLGEHFEVSKGLPAPKFPAGWGADGNPVEEAKNPYFVLINNALNGDKGLFCSTNELLGLWNIWTPILNEIEADPSIITTYKQGDQNFARSSDKPYGHGAHAEL
jgi:hexose-6-phosphate dehydrogenase